MNVLDIINSPWAIQPAMLQEIIDIYDHHVRGERIDISEIEARIGKPLANEQKPYEVIDGIAIIPVIGVLAKRMNLFSAISGGASTQLIGRDIKSAVADSAIKGILLNIDSPGGTVDGTAELSGIVSAAKNIKTVYAYANGLMASAAYWIGSAAQSIQISGPTTIVGSIGVVATHVDYSEADKKAGIKRTDIYAGKFKRIASNTQPLSKEGRQTIQDEVDYLYSLFVGAVALNRGANQDYVIKNMADGKTFIGQQAIDNGLVDGFMSIEEMIKEMSNGNQIKKRIFSTATKGAKAMTDESTVAVGDITLDYLRKNHSGIMSSVEDAAFAKGQVAGAEAERNRISGVYEQMMPGHKALIDAAMFDGKSTGPEMAVKILRAEKEARSKMAADLQSDAPKVIPPTPDNSIGTKPKINDNLPIEEQAKAAWDADHDLRVEFGGEYESYLAFRKADAVGLVKIHGAREQ